MDISDRIIKPTKYKGVAEDDKIQVKRRSDYYKIYWDAKGKIMSIFGDETEFMLVEIKLDKPSNDDQKRSVICIPIEEIEVIK